MNKKILSALLAFVMVFSTFTGVLAASGNPKVDWLVDNDYVKGDDTGDLMLNAKISRAEVAAMVARVQGLEEVSETLKSVKSKFTDMNTNNILWARGYVNAIENGGIINGLPDGTFAPERKITYGEVIKMLVMVNGDIPEIKGTTGYWATPYIAKASEVGILEGLGSITYTDEATREKIFEMVYNTIYGKVVEEEKLNTYTALVTEVDKVYSMGANEMGIVILKSNKDNKYEAKEYTRINFDNIKDHEDLLGKVIQVNLDKNNKITKYEVDKSYDYLMGHVEFNADSLVLNGKTYNVALNDSASNVSNKLQFVYHNDQAVDYGELLNNVDSDFARITIDRNRVIGIESFDFSKVEPIDKVNGNNISFIQGRSSTINKAFLLENNSLTSMDLKDLKSFNIGHVYGDKLLVSRNVELKGKLERVVSNRGNDLVVEIDGKEYGVSNKFDMLYSNDGKNFINLDSKKAYDDLYVLRGQDIVYGLDASNNINYITSSKVSNEDFYIVDRALVRDVRLIDGKGKKIDFEIDLRTQILDKNGSRIGVMNLKAGDLVYMVNDDKYIEKITQVEKYSDIKRSAVKVDKDSKGEFVLDRRHELNKDAISLVFHEDLIRLKEVEALDVDKVFANTKSDSDLRLYTLSDEDFEKLNLSRNVITSGDSNRLRLLIFTGFEQSVKDARKEVVELRYDYRPLFDDEIEGYVNSKLVRIKLEKDLRLESMKAGDHALVYINSDEKIMEGERVFKSTDKYVEVVDVGISSGKLSEVILKENGRDKSYWVSKDLIELGTTVKGSEIKYSLNKNGEIEVILVK